MGHKCSLVVGACACCGRWCDGTKILKSDLRLLLSAGAAFRTHSGRGRAQPMADKGQGTMGGGGAGGSASVSAAAASVSTPLVRYDPPRDVDLLWRDVYDFQRQPDKVAFTEGTRFGQISNESSVLDSRYSSRNHWQAFVTFRIMVRVAGEELYESREVMRSAAATW